MNLTKFKSYSTPNFKTNPSLKKKSKKKISGGIICIDNNRILMVKKYCSYAFEEFIVTIEKYKTDDELFKLFRSMTLEEKSVLYTMNDDIILHQLYPSIFEDRYIDRNFINSMIKIKFKFKKFYNKLYSKEKIKLYINTTSSILPEFTLPKGRKNNNETLLECAIREFEEETTLKKNQYRLFPQFCVRQHIKDNNIHYNYYYYLAILEDRENKINKSNRNYVNINNFNQAAELKQLSWITIDKLKIDNPAIYQLVSKGKKYLKNKLN